MSAPVHREFVALAHELADIAGRVQRRYFRQPIAVDSKPDASPVTIADREAEAAMRDLIASRAKAHGVLGEEFGASALDAEYVWVLDPIDGTKSFITGRPIFGTLVALLHDGKPVLGIIDQSIISDRWLGVSGEASRHNGEPICTRACVALADAVLFTTSALLFPTPAERAAYQRVEARVRLPMFGGDCYSYGLLAMGFADIIVEAGLQLYDFAAIQPIVEGAGGIMTGWQGEALALGGTGRVLACGDPSLHASALPLLAGPGGGPLG